MKLFNINYYLKQLTFNIKKYHYFMGIGDWGLGIGDWAQSP